MTLSPAAAIAKTHERELYLCSLFAPKAQQEVLWTILAFHHEIAKIPHIASEPMLALIRLQWWREALEAVSQGKIPSHEIGQGLYDLITQHPLVLSSLMILLEAAERLAESEEPLVGQELEEYIRQCYGTLFSLQASIVGMTHTQEIMIHAGMAYGMMDYLRQQWHQHGRSAADMVLVASAEQHIAKVQAQVPTLGKDIRPFLLPATIASLYCRAIHKHAHDLAYPVHLHPGTLPWKLWWGYKRGAI